MGMLKNCDAVKPGGSSPFREMHLGSLSAQCLKAFSHSTRVQMLRAIPHAMLWNSSSPDNYSTSASNVPAG
eukprot:1145376-Pelagomonas_calceolata.AAC.6